MTEVVGVTPSGITSAPTRALMKADLPALNSPTITSRKSEVRCSAARRTAASSSSAAGKRSSVSDQPLQQRQLVFDQLVLLLGQQRPRGRLLPVAARSSRQLKQTSAHPAPIVPRAGPTPRLGDDVSRSMEDAVDSDKP